MALITAGSSQTFTAGTRDAVFTVVTNAGNYVSVNGAFTAQLGPSPVRRGFGPLDIGQSITVTVQAGEPVIVEFGDQSPQEVGGTNQWLTGSQVAAGATGVAGVRSDGSMVSPSGAAIQSGGSLGPYTDLAALVAAKPAASNQGQTALIGAAAPYAIYSSDGKNWQQTSSASNRIALIKAAMAAPGARRHVDQPWAPPAAHQVSTLYAAGACVVNAGNIYYNCAAVSGTTGAASPPTTTGLAPVADGTVSWQYVGPTFTADASAPTLVNNGTTAPTGKKLYRNTGSALAGSTNITTNNGWFALGSGADNAGGNGLGSNTSQGDGWVSFDTDAPVIWVAKYGLPGSGFMVSVDGRYIQPGTFTENVTFGTTEYIQITFQGGYKRRNVTFAYQMSGVFASVRGVYVDSQYMVWAPNSIELTGPKIVLVGDSFFAQPAYSGMHSDRAHMRMAFGALGISNVFTNAAGGSGLTVGTKYGNAGRIASVVALDPDWIHIHGSVNDSFSTLSALTTELSALIAAYRSSTMGMKPIITLSGDIVRAGATGETTFEANLRQAVAAVNDPKLIFIPCSGDPSGPWVTGTGRVTATDGVGNADRIFGGDGIHPLQSGLDYFAMRSAVALRAIINAL